MSDTVNELNAGIAKPPMFRCFLAEFVGAFILTFADAGVGISPDLNAGIPLAVRALVPGLIVLALIFALGELSGAHFNPAVTFAFALRGVFPWVRLPVYFLCQFAGAICAAASLFLAFGKAAHAGATLPLQGYGMAFACEILLSAMLLLIILSTTHQSKITGPESAFPVAAVLIVCGLLGKGISGASMNPARSLGPALFDTQLDSYWIYAIGPLAGAVLAVMLVGLLHGPPERKEVLAAEGEKSVEQ